MRFDDDEEIGKKCYAEPIRSAQGTKLSDQQEDRV